MNILAIDRSTDTQSVALALDGKVYAKVFTRAWEKLALPMTLTKFLRPMNFTSSTFSVL